MRSQSNHKLFTSHFVVLNVQVDMRSEVKNVIVKILFGYVVTRTHVVLMGNVKFQTIVKKYYIGRVKQIIRVNKQIDVNINYVALVTNSCIIVEVVFTNIIKHIFILISIIIICLMYKLW